MSMKKFTLLLCLFVVSVMMPQVLWATNFTDTQGGLTVSVSDTTLTIESSAAGLLNTYMNNVGSTGHVTSDNERSMQACKRIVLIGKFNNNDLDKIQYDAGFNNVKTVDMSQVTPGKRSYSYQAYKTTLPGESSNLAVLGGTLYMSNCEDPVISSVDESASLSWNVETQSDHFEYNKGDYLNQKVGYYKIPKDKYYSWDSTNSKWVLITDESKYPKNLNNVDVKGESPWTESYVSELITQTASKDTLLIHGSDYNYYFAHYEKVAWAVQEYDDTGKNVIGNYSTASDLPLGITNGSYAVVGGTVKKYVYGGTGWTTLGVSYYDWSIIKFGKWGKDGTGGSIQTAVLPAEVYAEDLDVNGLWHNGDCKNITTVQSGTTVATIYKDNEEHKCAILDVAEGSPEFQRMEAILKINSFVSVPPGNISSSVGAAGYNETSKIYTLNGSFVLTDIDAKIDGKYKDIRVLDLKNLSEVTKSNLESIQNDSIEYIILPGNMTKAFVSDTTTYYSAKDVLRLKNLKAVISAEENHLVAHVVVPGHLAKARCYATGVKEAKTNKVAVMGLTSVTLSGNLNADDISTKGEDNGLSGEMRTITTMDLEKAYFPNYNDMSFLNAGFQGTKGSTDCNLKYISLPTTPRMTHIPEDCFRNLWSLDSLCIPFNYKVIHDGALYDSNVEHLTTTDSIGGVLIDHGPLTYTLSANLEQLGDEPSPKLNAQGVPQSTTIDVFPKENGVKEIYTLATKVPKCYKNVFSYALTFGYGGQDQEKVYGRDRYFNNGDSKKSFVVLRYPSKEVFDRRKAKGKPVEDDIIIDDKTISGYEVMEMKYTDVTKVFTKKDQTGAVDANGNPLLWPGRTEGNRAYNQASVGAIWDNWGKTYSGENDSEINDGGAPVENSSSRSMSRRFDSTPSTRPIEIKYVGNTSTHTTTTTNPETGEVLVVEHQGVTITDNGSYVSFTPGAGETYQNMFQYRNMPVAYGDGNTYKKIVIEFEGAVPDGYFIHAYGNWGTVFSLKDKEQYEIGLNGDPIEDFTIFNDNTPNPGTLKIRSVYFSTEDAHCNIDLTQGKSAEGVERTDNGNGSYTFTPTANVKNMFQYVKKAVESFNGGKYNKIVFTFGSSVPAGFNIHGYGERGEFYSLEGKNDFEIPLKNDTINDLTIFNWDDGYWNEYFNDIAESERRKITITGAYLTTEDYVVSGDVTAQYSQKVDFVDYIGWHQIILTQATYYEPVVKKDGETIKRNYKKTGACTFCIPYDLSYSQVVKMLGIPKSAGNVENYDENGTKVENNDKLPDIRQLLSVTRTVCSDHNQVDYRLSTNLAADPTDVKYLECKNADGLIKDAPVYASAKKRALANAEGVLTGDTVVDADPRCIIGGRPYIINAYVLNSDTVDGRNLGLYIMTRYAKELEDSSSCVKNGKEFYEQLSTYKVDGNSVVEDKGDVLTMRFAKPYEDHKIRAFSGTDGESGYIEYDKPKISNAQSPQTETKNYYYAMVGQFWEQDLPEYCVYMTRKGEWKRYTHPEYGFKWDRYKCVFMATPDITSNDFVDSTTVVQSLIPDEQTKELIKADQVVNEKDTLTKPYDYVSTFEHFGGGFRNLANCYFPMNYKGTYDWIPAPMKLWFFGRSDRDFETQKVHSAASLPSRTATLYTLTMDNDDEIIEYDGEVTNVKTIDMLDGVPQLTGKSRVYSLSGQFMGNTTEGLRKGVYIVDGRKIVVE